MTELLQHPSTVLRGDAFAQALASALSGTLPNAPLNSIKHRNILMPQMVGGELEWAWLGILASALRIRGAHVTALLCDQSLPACVQRKVDHHQPACVRWCCRNASAFAQATNTPSMWYGQLITPDERANFARLAGDVAPEDIPAFTFKGCNIGTLVPESVENVFMVGAYDPSDPAMVHKAYEFLVSGMCLATAIERATQDLDIDKLFMDSGRYIDWGVGRAIARSHALPVDMLDAGLRGHSVRFQCDRVDGSTDYVPGWSKWRSTPLTDKQEHALDQYLAHRDKVPFDFRGDDWHGRLTDEDQILKLCNASKPKGLTFSLFPNAGFDVGATRVNPAFSNAYDWIYSTIEHFAKNPQDLLIIRPHPAERCGSRDPIAQQIAQRFDSLPKNIVIVPDHAQATAQAVVRASDAVLVYTSTVGVEALGLSKPVITAGGGRHANQGVTHDPKDPQAYLALLKQSSDSGNPPMLDVDLARRYAYTVFMRANMPLNYLVMDYPHIAELRITSPDDLLPGRDEALDRICEGVLNDTPFDAEGLEV